MATKVTIKNSGAFVADITVATYDIEDRLQGTIVIDHPLSVTRSLSYDIELIEVRPESIGDGGREVPAQYIPLYWKVSADIEGSGIDEIVLSKQGTTDAVIELTGTTCRPYINLK